MVTPHKPEDAPSLSFLVHGAPKSGKTTFLGTAQDDARTFPMAFLNFESGESSLSGLDIDVFDIRSQRDFDEVYGQLASAKSPYLSVGFDSVTEVQIAFMLEILDAPGMRSDPDQLAQQDWGLVLTKMRRVVRKFVKMLPVHVFMTALTADKTVPRIGSVRAPSVQGQFANELPGIVDGIGYINVEEFEDGPHRVLVLDDKKLSAGVRTPWGQEVPEEIIDPTVTRLLDALGY